MLLREIIVAYPEIVNKQGNKLWSEYWLFLILKPGGT